jgi:hypothetical protein
MGKYTSYTRTKEKPRNQGVHPVMRGIGCILMIIVPILAYGVSILLVNAGPSWGWPIPVEWYGPPSLPPVLWNVAGLQPILNFLQTQQNLEANLIFTVVITIVIGGIMSMIYGYIYKLFGPPQYGPQDEPPIRGRKIKPYKR